MYAQYLETHAIFQIFKKSTALTFHVGHSKFRLLNTNTQIQKSQYLFVRMLVIRYTNINFHLLNRKAFAEWLSGHRLHGWQV